MKTNIMTIKQHVAENKRLLLLGVLSMNMSRHDDDTVRAFQRKTKNVRDKSNVLGDVKIISEK